MAVDSATSVPWNAATGLVVRDCRGRPAGTGLGNEAQNEKLLGDGGQLLRASGFQDDGGRGDPGKFLNESQKNCRRTPVG